MNNHNDSYDSRGKNASHDQSRQSAYLPAEKAKYARDDRDHEADPRETLKEKFEEAKRFLIDGHAQQASDRCMKAIKEGNDVFGENSVETLPGYFIAAEAYVEEGRLKKAEELLIGAYWKLSKHNPNEKQANHMTHKGEILDEREFDAFRGISHKAFGKLYLAKKEYDRALDEMKNGIYIDSMHYGPEDIQTSISYFIFGDVLIKSNQPDKGYSFYNQAIKIWYKFFKQLMRNADNESSEVDETIIKQGLSQLKGAEALFLDRLRNENEEEVIDDLHRLNYALAFIHRYVGEEDVALEYCRNVDGYLLGKYPQGHPKLDRFYGMFPHYHETAPREEDEEEDEDASQDEDEGGVSGQDESANRYENGENGDAEEIEGGEDEGEGDEGVEGQEDSGQYQGQEESQGQEEYQGQEDQGEGQYEGEQEGQGESGQQEEGEGEEEPQNQTENAEEEPEGQIEGEGAQEQEGESGQPAVGVQEQEGESGEPAIEQSGGNDASQDQ
jgi:hypothetical protein